MVNHYSNLFDIAQRWNMFFNAWLFCPIRLLGKKKGPKPKVVSASLSSSLSYLSPNWQEVVFKVSLDWRLFFKSDQHHTPPRNWKLGFVPPTLLLKAKCSLIQEYIWNMKLCYLLSIALSNIILHRLNCKHVHWRDWRWIVIENNYKLKS